MEIEGLPVMHLLASVVQRLMVLQPAGGYLAPLPVDTSTAKRRPYQVVRSSARTACDPNDERKRHFRHRQGQRERAQ